MRRAAATPVPARPSSPQPNVRADESVPSLSARFWALVALTGVGAGLGGAALMALLRAVQHLAWSYQAGSFLSAVERAAPERRVLVLMCAGVVAGVGLTLLRRAHGGHNEGGGLSEAIWLRAGRLPPLPTLAQGVLSIVLVGLGASLGREEAPKETGAAVAAALSDGVGLSDAQRHLLVACGAGAGMAAVYNVPFGGALFAVEVLLGTLSLPLVLPALVTALIATAVSWIYLPAGPTYTIPAYGLSPQVIVWAALVGPLAGLAAVAYVRAIAWADTHKPRGWRRGVVPFPIFAALGGLSIAYPQLLGNGKDVIQLAFVDRVGVGLLLALLVLKPLVTAACLGSGAPGGLFTPTLTYGALLGGLLGHAWAVVWPGAPPGSYAIIGAGAVLAAATQGPVSAVVLLLELTHQGEALLVPLLLTVAEATLVVRLLDGRSIYAARVHPREAGG